MIDRLISAQIERSSKSILLIGPRQTGKSTLLNNLQPDLTINLALESEYLRYSADAELFETLINSNDHKLILVDEIQRIPGLLNSIQVCIDQNKRKKVKFLLSGSSARKLRRGHANLLPGRIFIFNLGGLCAKELNYNLDFNKSIRFGFLPEVYFEKDEFLCQKLLENYSAIYLKEEIQAEALSRNIPGFARFLNVIASHAGQVLDFSKVATKAKVSRTSCVRFVEILEDTLIASRVPVFEEGKGADTVKHPKIFFFDVGVLNGLLNNFSASSDRIGNLFEHFLYNQLQNSAMALDKKIEFFYFRTRHGLEVDFIVRLENRTWAIEAKVGDIRSSDLNSLRAFQEYYPKVDRCVAVSPKEKKRKLGDILICNWSDLIKEMHL